MPKPEKEVKDKTQDKGIKALEARIAALETRVSALDGGGSVTPPPAAA